MSEPTEADWLAGNDPQTERARMEAATCRDCALVGYHCSECGCCDNPEVRSEISRDRRELWRLENFLAVSGTTEAHRERHLRLYRYLCDTCEHEWGDVSGWGGSPRGTRQCSWCNTVLAPGERLAPASIEPLPMENPHRAWQERNATRIIPPEAATP